MTAEIKQLKISFFDFPSCGGCRANILRSGIIQKITGKYDCTVQAFQPFDPEIPFQDITCITGMANAEKDKEVLAKIRALSRYVIACGTCAVNGNISNYAHRSSFEASFPVEFSISGCPVIPSEIGRAIARISRGMSPEIITDAVCRECKKNEFECVLHNNRSCAGMITRGGCGAICIQKGWECTSCRGLLPGSENTEAQKRIKFFHLHQPGNDGHNFIPDRIRGLLPHEIPHAVSRLSGSSGIGHQLAAISAIERALQITVHKSIILLRRAAAAGMFLHSHLQDIYSQMRVSPALTAEPRTGSDIKDSVFTLLQLSADFLDTVCGRAVHPVSFTVGGHRHFPDKKELFNLDTRFVSALETIQSIASLLHSHEKISDISADEYISVNTKGEYPIAAADAVFTANKKKTIPAEKFKNRLRVQPAPSTFSPIPFFTLGKKHVWTGPLARVNMYYPALRKEARAAAESAGIIFPDYLLNRNADAQVLEVIHFFYETAGYLNLILQAEMPGTDCSYELKKCSGMAVFELPSGMTFHEYTFDKTGRLSAADIIIPASFNAPAALNGYTRAYKKSENDVVPQEAVSEAEHFFKGFGFDV